MKHRIICVTCGGDRTDDNPQSSCEHFYISARVGTRGPDLCSETDVLCVPNALGWAAPKMLEALEGMVDFIGDDAAWLTEPAYEEMVAAIAAAKGERAERGT